MCEMIESPDQKIDVLLLSDSEWDKWKKDSKKNLIKLILKTVAKCILLVLMIYGILYFM
jgi:hypothetical protein